MSVIVFGSNGMLGRYVYTYLKKNNVSVIGFTRDKCDIEYITYRRIYNIIKDAIVIINCIGLIPQRKINNNRMYIKINGIFPQMLSTVCDNLDKKFIHITTDCVFDGRIGNYNEDSDCNETGIYGLSKIMGEMLSYGTIIRTSIIGEEICNKLSLLEWVKSNSNNTINGYTNHLWNGMTCLELSKLIYNIISQNKYWNGIRHFHSECITKYDLICLIRDTYKLDITINPISTDVSIDRTLSSKFDNNIMNINNLKDQLIELSNYNLC